ncbi:MAG: 50S ribosomal protein L31e [Candidatus Heimdallarchaeota archaeon]
MPFYPKLKLSTRQKRAPRAIRIMKKFIYRHMKAEDIIIDNELNEFIWARGRPPDEEDIEEEEDE